ncbi:hypothetical protein MPER_04887 [Moniliophthora perniciosa FA553]|nr:hypothetical protein MPER_04887 [Moniliophthora perniciosa FA553]
MFSKSSKPSKTIALLGLWHASIIAPTKELTLALVIDSADEQSCSAKGRPPPDADESFEAGQLSEDWSDSSDEEGSWHNSILAPILTSSTKLTLASAADKKTCSVKGWSPPDADESFEVGQLSEDWSDSADEEEERVFTRGRWL